MATEVKQLRIFIAFPSDCQEERNAVGRVVMEEPTIASLRRELNVSIEPFDWRSVEPALGRPQGLINAAVGRFDPDWIVFILWHRVGSDAGLGMTGIEEEWREARKKNEQGGGRPRVSVYFNRRNPPIYEMDEAQFARLNGFREQIFGLQLALVSDFDGTPDFELKFRGHLCERLLELRRELTGSPESTRDLLRHECLAASQALLSYPNTLGRGQHIERPETRSLLQRIAEEDSSTTVVLGGPGSGKSALIATLAQRLVADNTPILAIKADMLSPSVDTSEDLRVCLQLALTPNDALRAIAHNQGAVLLIDQLDAVSDILDRHSGRLNVLLNLIQSLSGQRGIHIVATCRLFEFHHDVRLSGLNAERLTLSLPAWEEISPILEGAGHVAVVMGQPLRELLQTPWHLKIFLDLASPGANFDSLHSLLGRLWDTTVLDPRGPSNRLSLLVELATRMSAEETLWVPAALADTKPKAREALERVEILQRSPNGDRIGFRHQSYFEFTLARSFARGTLSLAQHVLSRQDGLFVRPVLLNGLSYLRNTAPSEYHRELGTLFGSAPRLHIRSLLIECLGQRSDPDHEEIDLAVQLLRSEEDGPRVLSVLPGETTWLTSLRYRPEFEAWMRKSPDRAFHCLPFLTKCAPVHPQDVVSLLLEHWADPSYDALSLTVLTELTTWDARAADMVISIAQRLESWFVPLIADRMLESSPGLAPRILRADLDRRLKKAEAEQEAHARSDEALQEQTEFSALEDRSPRLGGLFKDDHSLYEMEALAEAAPSEFVAQIWPWLLEVVGRIAREEHHMVVGYRDDPETYSRFEGELGAPLVVRSVLAAVAKMAESDRPAFLEFVRRNMDSDFLIVHRIIARGMQSIAGDEPRAVLEYLLQDPRRLIIGDFEDQFRESKALISSVFPHLSPEGQAQLEEAIIRFKKHKPGIIESEPRIHLDRLKWGRRDRLLLLRAIPEAHMSAAARRLKDEEERALPGTQERERIVNFGCVGPRMAASELERAKDDDVLRLFDELPDGTDWRHPKREWADDLSRAGGAIQLSRELGELAKKTPERIAHLLTRLEPGRHETYAGAALEGLAAAGYPPDKVLEALEALVARGFGSLVFQNGVGTALEALARKSEGLSDRVLAQLRSWLDQNPEPVWPPERSEAAEGNKDSSGSILFGHGGVFSLPHGRGSLIRAIAAGYLRRAPPGLEGWGEVIESRLGREPHPAVWVVTLMNMSPLLNGDRAKATDLYDKVIGSCPSALRYSLGIYAIAQGMRGFEPAHRVQVWLEILLDEQSQFCSQAQGELLMLYRACHPDAWSAAKVREHLTEGSRIGVLRGLAYGAGELWDHSRCQPLAKEILSELAGHADDSVQSAVASVFFRQRDTFQLTASMRELIATIAQHPRALEKCAQDLVESLALFAGSEPALVSNVCDAVLRSLSHQVTQLQRFTLAETLTNVALTLHRLDAYREQGLRLFEQLLALNVREARAALDLLDRRPTVTTEALTRRRKRRTRPPVLP